MNNKKAQINTHTYPQTLPSPGFPILLTLIFPNATLVAKDGFPYHACPRVFFQLIKEMNLKQQDYAGL